MGFQRGEHRFRGRRLAAAGCLLLASCGAVPPKPSPDAGQPPEIEPDVVQRMDDKRIQALEREVKRLKTDLLRAEHALVAVESRLESSYSRANAVSSLAEAQMQLNKASRVAPWRSRKIEQARDKLAVAQKHIDNEYFGAAMFFVYRANRIVEELNHEARIVEATPEAMFINGTRVNIRSGPSTDDEILAVLGQGTPVIRETHQDNWVLVRTLTGMLGWVHESLVTNKEQSGS